MKMRICFSFMSTSVLKFGGTSMGTAASIRRCQQIVSRAARRRRVVVVVSALAGVTDQLISCITLARDHKTRKIQTILDALETRHRATLEHFVSPAHRSVVWEEELLPLFRELRQILLGTSLVGDITDRSTAEVCSYGERFSSRIMTLALRQANLRSKQMETTRLIRTDSKYLEAHVEWPASRRACRRLLQPLLLQGVIPVLTGFIARDAEGMTTLLGRGGSDYTASIVGICLRANAIEIWTDVDGVLSADPQVVTHGVRTWRSIELPVMSEMSHGGAKVLHPKTITAAVRHQIPVTIRNTFRPAAPGTMITPTGRAARLRGIVTQKRQTLLHFAEPGMLSSAGFIHRVSEVFREFGVPIDVCATSEISFTCSIDAHHYSKPIRAALAEITDVEVRHHLAKICIIGYQVTSHPALTARVLNVLHGVNLHALSIGASGNNITLLVDEMHADAITRTLHRTLFAP